MKAKALVFVLSLLSITGLAQNFFITANFGAGQATGELDHHEFAYTSEMGVGYETKLHIIALSAIFKTESYNFSKENDLMVFSLPITCEISPRFNPRPYAGISLIPGYPTQWLADRDFFLSGGLSGGIICEFRRLLCFAQYQYLADLTGYSHYQTSSGAVDRNYLNRYYISIGVRVRLIRDNS